MKKNVNDNLNIVISSWPSAGGTTLALMMSDLLNLNYIYAGGVLKDWAKKMGYDPSSDRFHEWEKKYGVEWDYFWEDYIKFKLMNNDNFLCEGKTAGFLLEKGRAFEVMVICDKQVRASRALGDKRTETVEKRDILLEKRWKKLFNIELFSIDQIKKNYDFVLNNTNKSISGSIIDTFDHLLKHFNKNNIRGISLKNVKSIAQKYEKQYWEDEKNISFKSGKNRLKKHLKDKDLIISNKDIYNEWKEKYSNRLKELPSEMSDIIFAQ